MDIDNKNAEVIAGCVDITRRIIEAAPAVDAVEVVRCKDCIHNADNMTRDPLDVTDYSGEDIVCSYFRTDGMDPDDFCSYGERREGNAAD